MIFFAAFLLAASQAGSMQVFIAEGFAGIKGMHTPSYFGSYKITGIFFFEILIPLYSFFIFSKVNKQIEKYDKEGIPIFQKLGWSYS